MRIVGLHQIKSAHAYRDAVQAIADEYNTPIATGQMSDIWQVREPVEGWKDIWTSEIPAALALRELQELTKDEPYMGPSNLERFDPKPTLKG